MDKSRKPTGQNSELVNDILDCIKTWSESRYDDMRDIIISKDLDYLDSYLLSSLELYRSGNNHDYQAVVRTTSMDESDADSLHEELEWLFRYEDNFAIDKIEIDSHSYIRIVSRRRIHWHNHGAIFGGTWPQFLKHEDNQVRYYDDNDDSRRNHYRDIYYSSSDTHVDYNSLGEKIIRDVMNQLSQTTNRPITRRVAKSIKKNVNTWMKSISKTDGYSSD